MAAPVSYSFENADTSVFSTVDISGIAGNAPDHVKRIVGNMQTSTDVFRARGIPRGFGEEVQERITVTEVSINPNANEPNNVEARMVMEIQVYEGMLNPGACVHGACSAYLVDVCSTFALTALRLFSGFPMSDTVSQNINMIYHSPALLGDMLRVVNTTLSSGAKTHSMKTEIWNVTRKRLVASGTHLKMSLPAAPKEPRL